MTMTTTQNTPESAGMQEAIEQNREMAVLALSVSGADVNARLENGLTPLQYAAELGAADCVRMLLHEGADPDLSYTGLKPLGRAAVQGHAACVELLLAGGAEHAPICTGNALVMAARAGHADCVRALLSIGSTDEYLYGALKAAFEHGHDACAAMLAAECVMMIDEGEPVAPVVVRSLSNDTELREFALQTEVLDLLLSPPRAATVMQAVCENDMAALKKLLAAGAPLCMNRVDYMAPSSLYYAVEYGDSEEAAQLLVRAGADVHDMGLYDYYEADYLFRPLTAKPAKPINVLGAVVAGNTQALEAMLRRGASPDKPRTAGGATPLMLAVKNLDAACVRVLLQHGAEVFVSDAHGNTLLHYARGGIESMIRRVVNARCKEAGITLSPPVSKKMMTRERFLELVPEMRGVTVQQKVGYLLRLLEEGQIAPHEPVVLQIFEMALERELFDECGELLAYLERCELSRLGDVAAGVLSLCVQHEQTTWAKHLRRAGWGKA